MRSRKNFVGKEGGRTVLIPCCCVSAARCGAGVGQAGLGKKGFVCSTALSVPVSRKALADRLEGGRGGWILGRGTGDGDGEWAGRKGRESAGNRGGSGLGREARLGSLPRILLYALV